METGLGRVTRRLPGCTFGRPSCGDFVLEQCCSLAASLTRRYSKRLPCPRSTVVDSSTSCGGHVKPLSLRRERDMVSASHIPA